MGRVSMMGMLESVVMLVWRAKNTSNVALRAGSSRHGKARRASVAWNCVTARALHTHRQTHRKTRSCTSICPETLLSFNKKKKHVNLQPFSESRKVAANYTILVYLVVYFRSHSLKVLSNEPLFCSSPPFILHSRARTEENLPV